MDRLLTVDQAGELLNTGPRFVRRLLLTTQYLDEAEQLADRIAILHQGTIIQNGTLAELKQLLPPAKVEYVEKQPSLEEVFLTLVGDTGHTDTADGDRSTGTASAGKEPR
jgi:ABC-2 type transport system ATP-binding protein